MNLPDGVTEADFLRTTDGIARVLASRFANLFGGPDDFAQEAVVWAIQALPKYDTSRPLANYLYRAIYNKCLNKIRDAVTRRDHPCGRCHAGDPCGADGQVCVKYAKWADRNARKARVYRTVPVGDVTLLDQRFDPAPPAEARATAYDLETLIDAQLPLELRADYLMMRDTDVLVPKARREQVQVAVAAVLEDADVDVSWEGRVYETAGRKPLAGRKKGSGRRATLRGTFVESSSGSCPEQRVDSSPGDDSDEQEDVLADGQDGVVSGTAEVPVGTEFGRSHQPSWAATGEDDANEHRLLSSSTVLNPGEVFD